VTPAATIDLRQAIGAAPRTFAVVTVDGPDALTYLQGQLSQELEGLEVGSSVPALLLQPTGKLTAWLRIVRTGDQRFELVVDEAAGDEVLARLRRFKLRTAADLDLERRPGLALRGPGAESVPVPDGVVAVDAGWPGVDGVDWIGAGLDGDPRANLPAGVEVVGPEVLEALRIECGVPAMGAELSDATIPAEAGQWVIDASVSFTKGCYTGQELVARIDSRGGNVPRPVRALIVTGDGPDDPASLVGSPVVLAGAEVGVVTSAARSDLGVIALGLVGRTVEPGAEVVLGPADESWPATVRAVPLR
jgi:folate-binding protein YgfZ